MNIIYHFKKYDLMKITEYLINNEKITYDLKDIIKYLEDKNISILTNDLYMTYSDKNINIFKYFNNGKKIHILDFNGEDIIKSESYKENLKTNNIPDNVDDKLSDTLIKISVTLSLFTYCFMKDDNFESDKRSSKNYKVISSNNSYKVKFKKLPIEIKIYNKVDGLFKYEVSNNCVKITLNNLIQTEKVVPSTLYPLPNNNFKIFTSENTFDLEEDTVNKLLSNTEFMVGACYTNSDKILKILKENNINAKYYSGWILRLNKMTHHAWIVIDDKHLIDVSILRKEDNLLDLERIDKIQGINVVDELSKMLVENIQFKDKYYYGKISRYSAIYIGSETNPTEARKSFNDLIRDIPNHPDYQNVDKNGINETQRTLYKNIYGVDI